MYASIWLPKTGTGSTSDDNGFYILDDLPDGKIKFIISCIGYDTLIESFSIQTRKTHTQDYYLTPHTYNLEEVSISSEGVIRKKEINISEFRITAEEIEHIPAVGTMPDLIQHINTLPGVVTTGDVGGQIFVRGGSPIQNKTIMDGAIVFSPVHSIGLFSVFDPDVIYKVELFTGGFNARYGGSISSILDVKNRYGNTVKYTGKAEISTIGSKLMIEGPIIKENKERKTTLSFLLTARNSYFDQALKYYYKPINNNYPSKFTDIYGKTTIISENGFKANLYGFRYSDQAGISGSAVNFKWTNSGIGGNILIMPFKSHSIIEGYFAISDFNSSINEKYYVPRNSSVNMINFGMNFINYMGENNIKYGLELLSSKTEYLFFSSEFNATEQLQYNTELSSWVQAHFKAGKFLIEPGFRLQWYSSLMTISPEPRIGIKFIINQQFRLKMAGGFYTQNLISGNSDRDVLALFTGYLSAPVNITEEFDQKEVKDLLQKSQHLILGLEKEFRLVSINAEIYYKNYPQLINYNRNKLYNAIDFPDKPQHEIMDFVYEKGFAYGLDISSQVKVKRIYFSLGYSLAYTKRFIELSDGTMQFYYPHFDRRHNINVTTSYEFGKKDLWRFSARWNYGSGFPFTMTVGYFEDIHLTGTNTTDYLTQNGNMGVYYDDLNNGRLPYYQRFDVSLKKLFPLKGNCLLETEISCINIFNEKNIFYIDRKTNEKVYQLPVMPGLRIGLEF
ncbi:MAG: TonB-dependent receptor [Bacteroidales bacterium]|nr:TonB-dependent receptor [Bacteroidales bacterium]